MVLWQSIFAKNKCSSIILLAQLKSYFSTFLTDTYRNNPNWDFMLMSVFTMLMIPTKFGKIHHNIYDSALFMFALLKKYTQKIRS